MAGIGAGSPFVAHFTDFEKAQPPLPDPFTGAETFAVTNFLSEAGGRLPPGFVTESQLRRQAVPYSLEFLSALGLSASPDPTLEPADRWGKVGTPIRPPRTLILMRGASRSQNSATAPGTILDDVRAVYPSALRDMKVHVYPVGEFLSDVTPIQSASLAAACGAADPTHFRLRRFDFTPDPPERFLGAKAFLAFVPDYLKGDTLFFSDTDEFIGYLAIRRIVTAGGVPDKPDETPIGWTAVDDLSLPQGIDTARYTVFLDSARISQENAAFGAFAARFRALRLGVYVPDTTFTIATSDDPGRPTTYTPGAFAAAFSPAGVDKITRVYAADDGPALAAAIEADARAFFEA